MGSYRCPIKNILKPKNHDEYHSDWGSYVCPVLRDEIETAANKEKYTRLIKLIRMGAEHFPNYFKLKKDEL